MAKPKKRKKPPRPSQPTPGQPDDSVHLEEKIEQASDAVQRFFTQYRIPMVVGLGAVLAVFVIASLVQSADSGRVDGWNTAFYRAMNGEPGTTPTNDQIRTNLEKVIADNAGEDCAAWMMTAYAGWLMGTGEDGDREKAFTVIDDAAKKFPESPLVKVIEAQYTEVRNADEGFSVPQPPVVEPTEAPTAPTTPNVELKIGPDGKIESTTPNPEGAGNNAKPEKIAPNSNPNANPATTTETPKPTTQPTGGGN